LHYDVIKIYKKREKRTMEPSELRQKTCCFTGHRALPVHQVTELAERTKQEIRSLILYKNVRFFGVGGAIGYDTLAAKVLFQMRAKEFPFIKVILVYPFDGFTSRWTSKQQSEYHMLLPNYNKVVCVAKYASREAYLDRDRHLVDGSAYCICYCTRSYGGTAYTVRYAQSQELEIHNVATASLGRSVHWPP
jgi:uncharacterized phage-like protein YoqJ